jgi:hypothetical protein
MGEPIGLSQNGKQKLNQKNNLLLPTSGSPRSSAYGEQKLNQKNNLLLPTNGAPWSSAYGEQKLNQKNITNYYLLSTPIEAPHMGNKNLTKRI